MRKLLCICIVLGICSPACAAFDPFANITEGIAQGMDVDECVLPFEDANPEAPMLWLLPLDCSSEDAELPAYDDMAVRLSEDVGASYPVGDFLPYYGVVTPLVDETEPLPGQGVNVINLK